MLEPTEALEVYYIIDETTESFDKQLLSKCIQVCITAKLRFRLVKFEEIKLDNPDFLCNDIKNMSLDNYDTDKDAIKRGLLALNDTTKQLKLKTQNSVWIVYITNCDIQYKERYWFNFDQQVSHRKGMFIFDI